MTRSYSTCQTVGDLRNLLNGLRDDVALFGDSATERYVSVLVEHGEEAGNAVIIEPGPVVDEVFDLLADNASAYCNGYESARRGLSIDGAMADAKRTYGTAVAQSFLDGYRAFTVEGKNTSVAD